MSEVHLHGNGKLTPEVVADILYLLDQGVPQRAIASHFGLAQKTISMINRGYRPKSHTARSVEEVLADKEASE